MSAVIKTVAASALLLCCTVLLAAPAPFYWWVSKVDGSRVCAQGPLGPGWQKDPRAYKDSRCEKLAFAK
jgi:hypothetical protein